MAEPQSAAFGHLATPTMEVKQLYSSNCVSNHSIAFEDYSRKSGKWGVERVTGIEPVYPAWKAGALADVLHPHTTALLHAVCDYFLR